MLTRGEDVEAHALRKRGWSISAIVRHLGRNRRTVRAYLNGQREPGRRRAAGPDGFAPVQEYCRIRLAQDPHLQVALYGMLGATAATMFKQTLHSDHPWWMWAL